MPEAVHLGSGKVREIYALGDTELLLVASDRISTFDVVLPTDIPDKGRVLTGLSVFWFERTRDIVGNHLVGMRQDGRSMECRRLEMLPVEFVVRGYLAGSGWVEYRETGSICGHLLPAGLVEADALPEPIVTPPRRRSRATTSTSARPRRRTSAAGTRIAQPAMPRSRSTASVPPMPGTRGLVLADTKFEFGVDADGHVTLGDEALTPDSSRYWSAAEYAPGGSPPSFDKQYVRDWCLATGWDRTPPGPALPEDVVAGTRARYVEAFERVTDIPFDRYLEDPEVVLCA